MVRFGKIVMENKNIKEIIRILENTYQGTTTALKFSTPFELLIATILSAQTNDNQVNRITDELFRVYSKPEQFAVLTPAELEPYIKKCGLYKNKTRNIIEASRILVAEYGGEVPKTREELTKLPGVGRKTANVVLSNAFGIPALAVDTHVFRVARRLGLSRGHSPLEVEKDLSGLIPVDQWGDAHHWLIWHGRKICSARTPKCSACPVANYCPTYSKGEETSE